ncbi:MAG: M2 family metallopeptidase [Acidobacteriota bacterium]
MRRVQPPFCARARRAGLVVLLALGLLASVVHARAQDAPPTVDDARAFLDAAEAALLDAYVANGRAQWALATYIIHDTQIMAAAANQRVIALAVRLAKEATRFDGLDLPADAARRMQMLKLALTAPAPSNPADTAEMATIMADLSSTYSRSRTCAEPSNPATCPDLGALSYTIATSRDEAALRAAWTGWRTVSPAMRDDYARYVELGNAGARALGFADLGAMWRAKYDMDPDAFAAELDRLWTQVAPLYEALHCHVRARLARHYGTDVVDPTGPIPAHLLGNMWAQQWSSIYDLVAPRGRDTSIDLTQLLARNGVDARGMVRYGERFFTSLGFDPLPESFWQRSMFTRPADRDVVCHASAWNVDYVDDLRIKMCIQITGDDFITVHHELGHNVYQRAYSDLPLLYRDSANDGFHEAIGDTVALSITPAYLVDVGLLRRAPKRRGGDVAQLMRLALDKIAFLPFGLLIDQWRWQVFAGDATPATYNDAWWALRTRYQGVAPPTARPADAFDPGAKYHVPASVPYARYFLATILQFQFHQALCETAGVEGPLHRCSIYGNDAAGEKLRTMLSMGASRPWPDALEVITGTRTMDAQPILDYFAPLQAWLDAQNADRTCGW